MNRFEYIIFGVCYKILQRKNVIQYKLTEPDLAVFSSDDIGRLIVFFGGYEKEVLDVLKNAVFSDKSLDLCVDIGANVGHHTRIFSRFFNSVIAFEPNEASFHLLQSNTKHLRNVKCYKTALSNLNGPRYFHSDETNSGKSKIINEVAENNQLMEVQTSRLDDFLRTIKDRISFIKIDVEGHETEVLLGAKKCITDNKPTIMIEVLSEEIKDGCCKSLDTILSYGYTQFWSVERYKAWQETVLKMARALKVYLPILFLLTIICGTPKGRLAKIDPKTLKNKHYEAIIAKF